MAAKKQTESEKRVGSIKRSVRYKDIREDLNNQLEHSGYSSKHTIDLVEDYMNLWITKQLLVEDIHERGVRVKYDNGGGQSGYKKNESVDQIIKVNAQMLKLLTELHLSPSDAEGDMDDVL
jgi:hypothetical protein